MSRRWHPPGRGWVRTIDCGYLAVWMRPEPDGLTIAMYAAGYFDYFDDGAETWLVRVPATSVIPYLVMDKPRRIRWVLTSEGDPDLGALSVVRATVRPSHLAVASSPPDPYRAGGAAVTINAVLHAAADELERREPFRVERDLRNGAGSTIFEMLYETAKQLYGWTAIQHLQRHLGSELPHGQIQHWREKNHAAVVKALRAAADEPVEGDLEVEVLRAKLTEFHGALAEALGWLIAEPAVLVRSTVAEVERLRRDNARLTAELAEERQRRRTATNGVPRAEGTAA